MRYFSTRDTNIEKKTVSAAEAIVQGLAPDGGLYIPESVPQVDYRQFKNLSYPELAAAILPYYLDDYDAAFLKQAAESAYAEAFGGKAGRTVRLSDGVYVLELWHGPTCAFKDYALQLMPRLLSEGKKIVKDPNKTRILVATSGDTGKAALEGYKDLDGIEIIVFYPHNGVSRLQRLQMATQRGGNVGVYAVIGNFDDTQTGVKKAFHDEELAKELAEEGICLSSANSINWGRLVPQIVYYFYAYYRVLESENLPDGTPVDFCVPTGNFGDIMAGYYAKKMGLPVGRLICASNRNNILTDMIGTGTYDTHREFFKTGSPSMDILISSNLERLLHYVAEEDGQVPEWMAELSKKGVYAIPEEALRKIREDFDAGWTDEETCARTIRETFEKYHYLIDTHTSVALAAVQTGRDGGSKGAPVVVLSTASPFKFPAAVLSALGETVPENDFEALSKLSEITGAPAPEQLTGLLELPERFTQVITAPEIMDIARGNGKKD